MSRLELFNKHLADCEYFMIFDCETYSEFGEGINRQGAVRSINMQKNFPNFYKTSLASNYIASMHSNLSTVVPKSITTSNRVMIYKLFLNTLEIELVCNLNGRKEIAQWIKDHN